MDKAIHNRQNRFLPGTNRLLLALLAIYLLCGCNTAEQETKLLFTGDILLSRNVRVEIEQRGENPWMHMEELFKTAHYVAGNLEGAVGEPADSISYDYASPVFDISASHIELLSKAGFHALSIENNHSFDLGGKGKKNTIENLLQQNITPLHFSNSPKFVSVGNVQIALIALNLVPGRNGVQQIPSIEVKQRLRLAKTFAGIVIVKIHWGSELLSWPNQAQRDAADWLTKNGADLIIGSHPHVVQQPELINNKPVFFSLGNHLFDQKYPETKKGLIADCRIRNRKFYCTGIATQTAERSFYPEVVESEEYKFPGFNLNPTLTNSGYMVKPVQVNATHNKIIHLQGLKGEKRWESHPIELVAAYSAKLNGKDEFLVTLEKHYSTLDKEKGLRPYVYSVSENGLTAKWRGSALAWPLIDAVILPGNEQVLCALHRGDSFINPDPATTKMHVSAYRWNGFGFDGENDPDICQTCEDYYDLELHML